MKTATAEAMPEAPAVTHRAGEEKAPPTWTRWYEIFRVVGHRPYLKKTIGIALIVGTVLFIINHLDEVLAGKAGSAVWVKGALTYMVPFVVSNLGLLVAARRPHRVAAAAMRDGKDNG